MDRSKATNFPCSNIRRPKPFSSAKARNAYSLSTNARVSRRWRPNRSRSPAVVRVDAQMQPRGQSRGNQNIGACRVSIAQTDGGASGALALHTYVPKGPNHVEFVNYIFAEKDAPEQVKRDMLQNAIQQTGTSGTIEQDDADTWPQIMRNARGVMGKTMTLNAIGLSAGAVTTGQRCCSLQRRRRADDARRAAPQNAR